MCVWGGGVNDHCDTKHEKNFDPFTLNTIKNTLCEKKRISDLVRLMTTEEPTAEHYLHHLPWQKR